MLEVCIILLEMQCNDFLSWQKEEEVEPFVFWPCKGQPIRYDMLTVTKQSETHVYLSNGDMLVVQDYVLKSTQVSELSL